MPLPLPVAPVAMLVFRTAAIAAAGYALARATNPAPRDQRAEDAMDDTAEGIGFDRHPDGVRAAGKIARTFRIGHGGPGVHVELAGLARLRLSRV